MTEVEASGLLELAGQLPVRNQRKTARAVKLKVDKGKKGPEQAADVNPEDVPYVPTRARASQFVFS